jgi:hypothetical protein
LAKIIISYRRSDSDVFAGRVRDRIASRYGEDSVFIDVDNIPFGKDFRVHIQEVMAEADAVLIVIGPKWLGASKGGHSRIKDDADPVRIEVETALAKGTPTIPILVGKTNMPKPEQLPDSLRNFAFINAAPVDTGRDFHRDLNRVMATINAIIGVPSDTAERAAIMADSANDRELAPIAPASTDIRAEQEKDASEWPPVSAAGLVGRQPSSSVKIERTADAAAVPDRATAASLVGGSRRASRWLVVAIIGCVLVAGAVGLIFMLQAKTVVTASAPPQFAVAPSAGGDARSAAPAATAPAVQSTAPLPTAPTRSAGSDPGADVVRAFYTALGRGDGATAAALVIPERQKGGLGAQAMTDFFSGNFQPLQLIGVAPYGQNAYQATYTFQKTAKSVVCANSVIVSVTQRNGQYLIQNIDARGGC